MRSRAAAPEVVATLAPLRGSPAGRLDVRILEVRGERRLNIRAFVTADTFTGYTRKGVCLTAEEFDALLEQPDRIRAALVAYRPRAAG